MKLQDIKTAILEKTIGDDLIIFLCDNNFFIADQYVNEIANIKNYYIQYINNLSELDGTASLINEESEALYILKTETFDELRTDYSSLNNVIILCNKLDKKVEPLVKDNTVKVPKLEEWQVVAYIQALCPGLAEQECKLFYKAANYDIYKVENELSKILLFEKPMQKEILMNLLFDDSSDMYSIDNLKLSNYIVNNDKVKIYEVLTRRNYLDLDPFPIIALVLNTFKNIVLVNHQSGITAFNEFGISPKQVAFYKNQYRGFNLNRLMDGIRFLSGIDLKLRQGLLDMPKDQLFDYVLCNVLQ